MGYQGGCRSVEGRRGWLAPILALLVIAAVLAAAPGDAYAVFPPTANDDAAEVAPGQTVEIAVLDNDTDDDRPAGLTVTRITAVPDVGTATIIDGTTISYRAPDLFTGTTFSYEISDGRDGTDTATVVVQPQGSTPTPPTTLAPPPTTTVAPATNTAPTAAGERYFTDEDVPFADDFGNGLLRNDTDPQGDPLTAILEQGPSNGTLNLSDSGTFLYTPDPDYHGTDEFSYRASDGELTSEPAIVSMIVESINDAPTIDAPSALGAEPGVPARFEISVGDVDADDAPSPADEVMPVAVLTVNNGVIDVRGATSATVTNNGTAIVAISGELAEINAAVSTVFYISAAGFSGDDVVTIGVRDNGENGVGGSLTTEHTIPVTVAGANSAPIAVADEYSTSEDIVLVVNAAEGVLANDTDADGDGLSANNWPPHSPTLGSVVINSDGSFVYTPDVEASGTDTFGYRISDGVLQGDQGVVTVVINAVNDAPMFTFDSASIVFDEDGSAELAVTISDVDTDPADVSLGGELLDPALGSVAVSGLGANRVITVIGAPDANGETTLQFGGSDGSAGVVEFVPVTITPVNDAPVGVGDSFVVDAGEKLVMDVLANDSDVDGDVLVVESFTNLGDGSVVDDNGDLVYEPATGFSGIDTFTYIASDGLGGLSEPVTVQVTVNAGNSAPTIEAPGSLPTNFETAVNFEATVDDVETDAGSLVVTATVDPALGVVTASAPGTDGVSVVEFAPSAGVTGDVALTITVSDGQAETSVEVVVSVAAGSLCEAQTEIPTIECEALLALYESTNGPGWTGIDSPWSTNTPCSWAGVTCLNGRVKSLFLPGNGLSGPVPAELGDLSNLTLLWLPGNGLSGPVPAELGVLSNLSLLGLHDNDLSGSIPAELGVLNLIGLRLEGNNLSGPIPAELGTLSNLEALFLNDNNLSGPVPPELANLPILTSLNLSGNELSGQIPAGLFGLINLNQLELQENGLSGVVPDEVVGFSGLLLLVPQSGCLTASSATAAWLDVNHPGWDAACVFGAPDVSLVVPSPLVAGVEAVFSVVFTDPDVGDVHSGVIDWGDGTTGDLGTIVSGVDVPHTYGVAGDYTVTATVTDPHDETTIEIVVSVEAGSLCEAQSEIPTIECEALVALYESTNGPEWNAIDTPWLSNTPCMWTGVVCDAGHVTGLGLLGKGLSGVIPPELGDLANLEGLHLGRNNLSGEIPVELGSLSDLLYLRLFDNALSGPIPVELGGLSRLVVLSLSENSLSGEIPVELGDLMNLGELNLAGNDLSGQVPTKLGDLGALVGLNLRDNDLSGPIPAGLFEIASIISLGLAGNGLSGVVPDEVVGFSGLLLLVPQSGCLTASSATAAWLDVNHPGWDAACVFGAPDVSLVVPSPLVAGVEADFAVVFTDPDVADVHAGVIDWGDGSSDDLGTIVSGVDVPHTYGVAGDYTVTVTVTDPHDETTIEIVVTVTEDQPACTITGTPGPDRLVGTRGDDVICGLGGDDRINGRGGNDILLGGSGNDQLFGGAGRDVLEGGAGDDLLRGGRGADSLLGGDGNDRLFGGRGSDEMFGGFGDDLLRGGPGRDVMHGGPGDDAMFGGPGNDELSGGPGDDLLRGNTGADRLSGGPGNDDVQGGPGNDTFF